MTAYLRTMCRALVRNRCAEVRGDWIYSSDIARAIVRNHLRDLADTSRGRGRILFTALAELLDAIPQDSEIMIRDYPAAAADVLLAVYDIALRAERR